MARTAAPKAAPADEAPAKRAPAKKAAAKKAAATKAEQAAPASEPAPAKTAPEKKAPVRKAPAKRAPAPAGDADAAPPEGWSAAELAAVRAELEAYLTGMRADYARTMSALDELRTQGADGAGDDQADAGNKTFEREHEMSLANNRRDLIEQLEHAVARIDRGTYGQCESCGRPIAKARLQAFPGATLCVACKQRAERR